LSWKYSEEYYRNYTRETWDECAEKYIPLARQLIPYHMALLSLTEPKTGERVLDVCTGPGEPAMTIASMIAPNGQVTGIDLSSNMTEMARKTAEKRQLKNIEFLTMDAEKLELPDKNFDLAISCFGFQIITQPEVAAKEIFRVLKPGGRAGFTVWSTQDRAQAIDVIVAPMLRYAEPDETGYLPTPYELGGPGEFAELLQKIGFTDLKEIRKVDYFRAPTVDEFLSNFLEGTPIGHSLGEEDEVVQREVKAEARRNISRYQTNNGIAIPCECVIVRGQKAQN
jgi:ubiquinone/menaquinone biosynthesis C-methylase UbiE